MHIDSAISIFLHSHMQRTTILLPEDLHRKGISLSELIRKQLTDCVQPEPTAKPAFFSRQPWTGNGADDVAARHDDYLYGP
jgi:hypothetical protein